MQEQVAYEEEYDINELKDHKKADRMLRSEAARARRKETKHIREMKIVNEWAKNRRDRHKK